MQDDNSRTVIPGSPNSSAGQTSVSDLSDAEILAVQATYEANLPRSKALLDEVVFILNERVAAAGIKIHGIEPRIKQLPSVLQKCRRKGISNIEQLVDVVGARVVSLFRSDLPLIGKIITDNFDVIHVDDKLAEDQGALGYMSVHYVCKMPSRYKGPRYENTSGMQFEVQVRTLCMHAWAAVSHYLDYKGDWDVPAELKRSLNALSGLFYVADTEFEQFYAARIGSKKDAEGSGVASRTVEVNLDTITAFLTQRFPDRRQVDEEDNSSFVRELKRAGFESLSEIEREIDRAYAAFLKYEEENPPAKSKRYAAIGAARLSLGLSSKKYYAVLKKYRRSKDPDELLGFRKLLEKET
jgi:ppGpp synthetase/RelA/SpoT-type nucleotidyltranferase